MPKCHLNFKLIEKFYRRFTNQFLECSKFNTKKNALYGKSTVYVELQNWSATLASKTQNYSHPEFRHFSHDETWWDMSYDNLLSTLITGKRFNTWKSLANTDARCSCYLKEKSRKGGGKRESRWLTKGWRMGNVTCTMFLCGRRFRYWMSVTTSRRIITDGKVHSQRTKANAKLTVIFRLVHTKP